MGSTWWHLGFQRDVVLANSLAPSTFRTYRTGINHYSRFCQTFWIPPLPLTQDHMERFCVSLQHRIAYKSIKVYLCGVQLWSTLAGCGEQIAEMPRLQYVLRGIRRLQGNLFTRPLRTPVTWPLMQIICRHIVLTERPFDRDMLLAAVLLAFFGLMRVSEYASSTANQVDPDALSVQDVTISVRHNMVRVVIKKSKTDPFRMGITLRICAISHPLCPVRAIIRFLRRRGTQPGPLFRYQNGTYLTRQKMRDLLARSLPFLDNVNTHSFRRGGASALADAGVPGHVIQILGRWKSGAYTQYIRYSEQFLRATTARMVGTASSYQ